jgi:hypothetical protein
MDVAELIDQYEKETLETVNKEILCITGWLVVIDGELYILEKNYSEPYDKGKKIKIIDNSIIYSVRDKILPLGGGYSFVFHETKALGFIKKIEGLEFIVKEIMVKERGADFIKLDISGDNTSRLKEKYGDSFVKKVTLSSDWLDNL